MSLAAVSAKRISEPVGSGFGKQNAVLSIVRFEIPEKGGGSNFGESLTRSRKANEDYGLQLEEH
jgi:hypothetical protein